MVPVGYQFPPLPKDEEAQVTEEVVPVASASATPLPEERCPQVSFLRT